MRRLYVSSFGAAGNLFLDWFKPGWKSEYFKHALSMEAMFELKLE